LTNNTSWVKVLKTSKRRKLTPTRVNTNERIPTMGGISKAANADETGLEAEETIGSPVQEVESVVSIASGGVDDEPREKDEDEDESDEDESSV
jgi:hypothetical protein